MQIKEILMNIPHKPGVYIMKDKDRRVLYVGKAKNLKNRVNSYFQKDLPSPWIKLMVRQIDNIETILVTNEFESLLLENNLIKKYHPRYNIRLKDDKTFPYLKLTSEEFPRLTIVRKVTKDGGKYFGPYLSAYALRQTVFFIRKNFGIVTHTYRIGQRPCLNYQIGLCSSPYAGKVSKEEYEQRVRSAINFLKGDYKDLMRQLNNQMRNESARMNFEAAAKFRDQVNNLSRLIESQNIVSTRAVNRDVIVVYKMYSNAAATIMKVRQGKLLHSNSINFPNVENFNESDILQAVLSQYYIYNMDIPKEILVNVAIEDMTILLDAFASSGVKTKIIVPKLGEKKKLIDLALENATHHTEQYLTRSKVSDEILESLKKDLQLAQTPQRIEAFDISNLGANQAVGAMVTFVKGVPYKNHYRKFIIKSVDSQNDVAMMKEVIIRRFMNKELPRPNLILIDGGKGQLNAAYEVLKSAGLKNVAIIGLAKKYELIFKPGVDLPIALNMESKSLLLLRAIRDEVHRFGIGFHRDRRGKEFLK